MATIDPTRNSAVRWWDIEGPDRARLTVGWLDERGRELAIDIHGLHAYWMAQCFKARDATIATLRERVATLERAVSEKHAENASLRGENMILRGLVSRIVFGPRKHLTGDARAYLESRGASRSTPR